MSNPDLLPHPIISKSLLDPEFRHKLRREGERASEHDWAWEEPSFSDMRGKGYLIPSTQRPPDWHTRLPVVISLMGDKPAVWDWKHDRFLVLAQDTLNTSKPEFRRVAQSFICGDLSLAQIVHLVSRDMAQEPEARTIRGVSPDFVVSPLVYKGLEIIEAANILPDRYPSATGEGVVWAVVDSGIDEYHEHFKVYGNLSRGDAERLHKDFTGSNPKQPLVDTEGHGTHVAGIIAGALVALPDPQQPNAPPGQPVPFGVFSSSRISSVGAAGAATIKWQSEQGIDPTKLRGVAPRCQLVSLKVFGAPNANPHTPANRSEAILNALDHVRDTNQRAKDRGDQLVFHGVNLSLGYDFGPDSSDCGQTPVCEMVNRLVTQGVVVIAAAGNTGNGLRQSAMGQTSGGLPISINDPGNADLAITVGSVKTEQPTMPGQFVVSYFSSKGPTADGREKPDLLAPGEFILSCATGDDFANNPFDTQGDLESSSYTRMTGTSQAAPFVSGAVAAFLSAYPSFKGQASEVKEHFLKWVTPLDPPRRREIAGQGVVNLEAALHNAP